MKIAVLLALLCLQTCPILATEVSQCPVPQGDTATVKFSLTCRRNQTGYWTAQLHSLSAETDGVPLSGEITQSTSFHRDIITILIDATINVPLKAVADVQGKTESPLSDYIHWAGDSYYKFYPEAKTWVEARDACAQEGTHLAVINSEAESKFVAAMWNSPSEWAYIGTREFHTEGVYLTVFDETLNAAGYNKWMAGEPNGGTLENCGLVNRNSLLANYFCYLPMPYICEYTQGDATKVTSKGFNPTKKIRRSPSGYRWFEYSYYKYHPEARTWMQARDICAQEGAHLAVLNSEGEAKFVSALWQSGSDWSFIGTHDFFTEGQYVTIFNETLDAAGYNKWTLGEPNGGTLENCGLIHRNSLLGNYFCYLPMPFICELPSSQVPIKVDKPDPLEDYTWFATGYYKAHSEQKTWLEARDICFTEGAHLAVINSEAEAKHVTSLWTAASEWAFIGTHDFYDEGQYVTIFNQTLDAAGYNKWVAGEPNGGTGENCGLINKNSLLGNYFCYLPMPFICEFDFSRVRHVTAGHWGNKIPARNTPKLPAVGYTRWAHRGYYKVYPEAKPWAAARDTCTRDGGHLAVINSDEEARFIASLWNTVSAWAYIGTHDFYTEGSYLTIFNETLDTAGYNKWFGGEPNGGTAENCGLIHSNSLLGNYFCFLPMPFVCEIPARVAGDNWNLAVKEYSHWPGLGYYKAHRDPANWTNAGQICNQEGGHLTVINSEAEAKVVTSLWNFASDWAYIGTHDQKTEGVYMTIYDETLNVAGYNKWVAGEPNGGTAENCGLINRNSLLGNYFCPLPMPFICEIDENTKQVVAKA